MREYLFDLLYLVATICFVFGIKRMGRVSTARSGNQLAAVGMLLAVIGIVLQTTELNWYGLVVALVVGALVGGVLARRVAMTAMPEMVAALNGVGGAASALVTIAIVGTQLQYLGDRSFVDQRGFFAAITIPLSVLIGWVTLSGSLVAFLKLQGKKLVHPLQGALRHQLHIALLLAAVFAALWMIWLATGTAGVTVAAIALTVIALVLGVLLVLPIGGADMPVVVSLLNSYSGIAASFAGFVVGIPLLVVAGALVGAAGLVLTQIMCKAMNRSLPNVLVGGMGEDNIAQDATDYKGVKSTTPEEVAMLFDGVSSVIVVPGYGLAVSQAQHVIRELGDLLEKRGVLVRYAIHPVAGRMPGHMNVLLAEADVSYDKLVEMDAINGDFKNTDVVIVVGANDVVNPAARQDPNSPIAGMPILNVDEARTVVVIKRSLSPGYAGIKNPLFELDNTLMVFMDAKQALQEMVTEVKQLQMA